MDTPFVSWEKFWAASGAQQAAPGLLADLLTAWTEPQRHYHTLQHLAECMVRLEACWPLAERPAELCLALLFHDAVYDPRAADNEARSATWAGLALTAAGFAPDAIARICAMILATHHAGEPATGDTALLLDIDLAILAAEPLRFAEYEAQVRAEYAWVAEPAFRAARCEILQGFLARPQLYQSEHFRATLEQPARLNLQAALQHLLDSAVSAELRSA
jgi:predicted metal-dependent HD superfamily phosphohydrolase